DAQVYGRADLVLYLLALQLLDRLLEELHIHVESDRLDVSALLAAEQIACPADLEVERRDTEAAAEVAELPDRGQPLLRNRRERLLRRDQKVGIGAAVRATDPSAELIELRQSIPIGAIDDDGVGVGNVEAVLDDRRRQQ